MTIPCKNRQVQVRKPDLTELNKKLKSKKTSNAQGSQAEMQTFYVFCLMTF